MAEKLTNLDEALEVSLRCSLRAIATRLDLTREQAEYLRPLLRQVIKDSVELGRGHERAAFAGQGLVRE
jgi:hypothetical protein